MEFNWEPESPAAGENDGSIEEEDVFSDEGEWGEKKSGKLMSMSGKKMVLSMMMCKSKRMLN